MAIAKPEMMLRAAPEVEDPEEAELPDAEALGLEPEGALDAPRAPAPAPDEPVAAEAGAEALAPPIGATTLEVPALAPETAADVAEAAPEAAAEAGLATAEETALSAADFTSSTARLAGAGESPPAGEVGGACEDPSMEPALESALESEAGASLEPEVSALAAGVLLSAEGALLPAAGAAEEEELELSPSFEIVKPPI